MKKSFQIPITEESKKLSLYLNKEMNQFSKEFKEIKEADVRLKQDVGMGGADKICQVYLKTATKNVFAIDKGRTFEEALRKTLIKLRNQANKLTAPAQEDLTAAAPEAQ